MSCIAVIRKVTCEDLERVESAARSLCKRQAIPFDQGEPGEAEMSIEYWLHDAHPEDKAYPRNLWTGCYCRALGVPVDVRTTMGWGHIGVSVGGDYRKPSITTAPALSCSRPAIRPRFAPVVVFFFPPHTNGILHPNIEGRG